MRDLLAVDEQPVVLGKEAIYGKAGCRCGAFGTHVSVDECGTRHGVRGECTAVLKFCGRPVFFARGGSYGLSVPTLHHVVLPNWGETGSIVVGIDNRGGGVNRAAFLLPEYRL